MLGERLLIRMWETLAERGVGSLASPWQIKREGKAHAEVRRDEILMLAQAEHDAASIRQGKKQLLPDGRLLEIDSELVGSFGSMEFDGRVEPVLDVGALSNSIEVRKKAEDIQREVNLNKAIIMAEEELLRSTQEAPEESVDPDWIIRWRDYAQSTQAEELRRMWARTLAGEITSPGSYSLRTLEFIKNLSQAEALSISKMGSFASRDNFLFKCDRLLEVGIDLGFLLHMDELGVLSGVQAGVSGLNADYTTRRVGEYFNFLICGDRVLLVEHEDQSRKLSLGCYQLSKMGRELLSLGDFRVDEEYMRQVGLKVKGQGFKVSIATWIDISTGQGQYINPIAL